MDFEKVTFKLRSEGWEGDFHAQSVRKRLQKARTAHAKALRSEGMSHRELKEGPVVGEGW